MHTETTRKRRRSVRRAVALECALRCELWDEAVHLPASNLSTDGVWVETPLALTPGDELIVSFTPPGDARERTIWAAARVVRSTRSRRAEDRPQAPGMALAFTYCSERDRRILARCLLGRPPRLPRARVPPPIPSARLEDKKPLPVMEEPAEEELILDVDVDEELEEVDRDQVNLEEAAQIEAAARRASSPSIEA